MSAALVMILPVVWATEAAPELVLQPELQLVDQQQAGGQEAGLQEISQVEAEQAQARSVVPELAFYRKYTEGLLRRYVRLSMEAGKVPCLMGQEMFRGNVTNYAVSSFEDVIIFVHDVERCMGRLDQEQQMLIRRIALQEFTQGETAELMGWSIRSVNRRYSEALDRLTKIFLKAKMLHPATACQEAGLYWFPVSCTM
jgi:Sigma-70, region 4